MNDKLQIAKEIFQTLNKNFATTEDVAKFFRALMGAFQETRTQLTQSVQDGLNRVDRRLATLKDGKDARVFIGQAPDQPQKGDIWIN